MSTPKPKSDTLSDFSHSTCLTAQMEECIQRIKAFHGLLFRKSTTDLLLIAYRLGIELSALRSQTRHGQWEKLFDAELAFVPLWTAKRCIRLAKAFNTDAELAGLTLEEARRLAQIILGKRGQCRPAEKRKKRTRKSLAGLYDGFLMHLDGFRYREEAEGVPLQMCDAQLRRIAAIEKEMAKSRRAFEKRREMLLPRLVGVVEHQEQASRDVL